jgi:cation diffusion facilitator family transporter
MQVEDLGRWQHSHAFGQDVRRPGETRALIVIVITGVMMVAEIAGGLLFGSMALLADGLHMASHVAALGINVFAYAYARRHAHDARFSFGTGKVNTLGGFTGAVLLAGFALLMATESATRLVNPVEIAFNQAIVVAFIGLLVNGVSLFVLSHDHEHGGAEEGDPGHGSHDHNLIAAYLHVLADALTSVLAIGALLAAKYLGAHWMDPVMGFVGAILVARWSLGLLRATSSILLDRTAPREVVEAVARSIECEGRARISDLHVWPLGAGFYAAIVAVVTDRPRPPSYYKQRIPAGLGLVHVAVEVHTFDESNEAHGTG